MVSDIPRRRDGYYYKEGKKYKSITTLINEIIAKPALLYYQGQRASEIALQSLKAGEEQILNTKEVMAQLQLELRQSQDRGKVVHYFAQLLAMGQPLPEPAEKFKGYIEGLKSWWSTFNPEVLCNEFVVYSEKYMTAGRLDLLCTLNKLRWIIDFKSNKEGQIYKEVGLQLTFYKQGLTETTGFIVDKTGVVCLAENGEFNFRETNDKIEDFEHLLGLWYWKKRKER